MAGYAFSANPPYGAGKIPPGANRVWKELSDWRRNRADAGRLAHGLPKSNKFGRGVRRAAFAGHELISVQSNAD
jgi:hypothetical protein